MCTCVCLCVCLCVSVNVSVYNCWGMGVTEKDREKNTDKSMAQIIMRGLFDFVLCIEKENIFDVRSAV